MTARSADLDRRRDGGLMVVEFALVLAVFVLPILVLVATAPVWVAQRTAAVTAAGETARAVALDPGGTDPSVMVADIGRDHDLLPGSIWLESVHDGGRGSIIEVTVGYEVPVVRLPGIGDIGGYRGAVTHRERRPDYANRVAS